MHRDEIEKTKAATDREQLSLQLILALKTQKLVSELWKLDQPTLLHKLRDDDALVRWSAINIVARKRIHAEEILIGLLSDPTPEVRCAAQKALVRLGRGADFGPQPQDSASKIQLAMQRRRDWLSLQDPPSAAGSQRPTPLPK